MTTYQGSARSKPKQSKEKRKKGWVGKQNKSGWTAHLTEKSLELRKSSRKKSSNRRSRVGVAKSSHVGDPCSAQFRGGESLDLFPSWLGETMAEKT